MSHIAQDWEPVVLKKNPRCCGCRVSRRWWRRVCFCAAVYCMPESGLVALKGPLCADGRLGVAAPGFEAASVPGVSACVSSGSRESVVPGLPRPHCVASRCDPPGKARHGKLKSVVFVRL